jgi:hypothetical protein
MLLRAEFGTDGPLYGFFTSPSPPARAYARDKYRSEDILLPGPAAPVYDGSGIDRAPARHHGRNHGDRKMKDCMQMMAWISREALTAQDGEENGRNQTAERIRSTEETASADHRVHAAGRHHRR